MESWRLEVNKFTPLDELCTFDQSLISASNIITSRFKNWIEEEWEESALTLKNASSYSALRAKYVDMYFLDPNVNGNTELRLVNDIEWLKVNRISAYFARTEIIKVNDVEVPADLEYTPYTIDREFHDMIRAAHEYNSTKVMVPMPIDLEIE